MPLNPILEAVPNFSEGRRHDVIDAITRAAEVPGVALLHRTSDHDHNRTVLTLAGEPDAILEGLFRSIASAAERINLFEQRGVHPRLGAADVVPLVPIRDVTLDECVGFARKLGERIGRELALPVYLYEAAATRPERRNLADLRRGQFERLVAEIGLPERVPDFGPARVGPAGAVILGARPFLIAFNIFLQSEDVGVARSIARQIRESSGGLPGVKALGLLVDGQAQVSMNLVDLEKSPLHRVVDTVARLAADRGVGVVRSELIGLMPESSMVSAMAHYLLLPDFSAERILETALSRRRPGSN